jgi:hypothetical protein
MRTMNLARVLPGLLLVAAFIGGIELLYWSRASAIRALALRLGFQYSNGAPHWSLRKDHSRMPSSLRLRGSRWIPSVGLGM